MLISLNYLVFLDLDNTVIHPTSDFNQSNAVEIRYGLNGLRFLSINSIDLINKLHCREDVAVILCTGRRYENFLPVAERLPHDIAVIEHGGSMFKGVTESAKSILCPEKFIPPRVEDTVRLWECAEALSKIGFQIDKHGRIASFRIETKNNKNDQRYLNIFFSKIIEHIGFGSDVIATINESCIDIIPSWSGKMNAVRRIAALNEINQKDIFAAGDDINDLDMLRYAGRSYCAANAVLEVKMAVAERNGFVSKKTGMSGTDDILKKILIDVDHYIN